MTEQTPALDPRLQNICVVLFEPQNDINIGTTIRACKNFGVHDIRLVRPRVADPSTILISAPKAEDIIDNLKRFETLAEALADCTFVVGTTSRQRKNKRLYLEPRGAAMDMVDAAAGGGRAAIMFGREDHGLPNEALAQCHATVTVPTDPEYASLNLGQAVLLLVWEIFRVAQGTRPQRAEVDYLRAEGEHSPVTREAFERLLSRADGALTAIDFLKPGTHDHMMTTIQEMFLRAGLDDRELAIWHGIFSQIHWALGQEEKAALEEGGVE